MCRATGFRDASARSSFAASYSTTRGLSGKPPKHIKGDKHSKKPVSTVKTSPEPPPRTQTAVSTAQPKDQMVQVDGMPRFPDLSVPGALRLSDYVGTAIFAVTGSLAAAARGMDILGSTIVGTITAVGGGTIRDLLLGKGRRAFWMEEVEYLWICVVSAGGAFLAWPHLESYLGVRESDRWVDQLDALGVGAFAVIGVQNGIRAGVPCLAAIACGMFTATFGGVIRDVLTSQPVRILHSYTDIYATTALAGATTYMLVRALNLPVAVRIVSGVLVAIGLRNAAWTYDLRLPTYAGPMVDSSGLDTHMAPSKEVMTADFFKRKVSNDTTSTVSKEFKAPCVPSGSFAAKEKGDAGSGTRPPLAQITAQAFNMFGVSGK